MNSWWHDNTPATKIIEDARVSPVLHEVVGFGSNPGNLKMKLHAPDLDRDPRPLVVVLHGCGQTAAGFDAASGWSRLADTNGFVVLYPEQQARNNQKTCFSWFEPNDTRRGGGEVESIRQMVAAAVAGHNVDPKRIFIVGLSAGGAMANAMLAVHPELFAAGAIVAGLPYGTASNVAEAVDSMATGRIKDAKVWGDKIRAVSGNQVRWPRVAIWHGTADTVVKPINAGELVKQWTNVHGIGAEGPEEDHIGTVTRRIWRDARRRPCVTEYSAPGLGHGMPVDSADPPAPFFLPAGVSATAQIARDWGVLDPKRPASLLSRLGLRA